METEGTQRTGFSRHALIMLLCCLIPLGILAALWAIGVSNNYLLIGVLLLCPLMHVMMMVFQKKSGDGGGHAH